MKSFSPDQANRFFIDKVMAQSARSNYPLSEAERYMLGSSREEGVAVQQDMVDRFHAETTDKEFKEKIEYLLTEVYEHDTRLGSAIRETYFNAYNALKNHNYYIVVMMKEALGPFLELTGASLFPGLTRVLIRKMNLGILDMIVLAVTTILVFVLLVSYYAFTDSNKWLSIEWKVFILNSLTYMIIFNYLTRTRRMFLYKLSFFEKRRSNSLLILRVAFTILPVLLVGVIIYFYPVKFPGLGDSLDITNPRPLDLFVGPGIAFIAAYYYEDILERIALKKAERNEI